MKIVYIHGASATSDSFNYIRQHLGMQDEYIIEYDSDNGFHNNLECMKHQLKDLKDIFFVCHSLGGIYALHLTEYLNERVVGACTISTPYGGAESADYTKYFLPFSRLLRDIGPRSDPIRVANNIKLSCPWTNIVTIRGSSPWIIHDNDGVVTVKSMKCRDDMDFVELDINHYEVVLSPDTVKIIKEKIKEIK
jgi:pimeloyl-ACP methyl ester carboxylesterase